MQQKQVFRRMNLDSDVRSLKPGEYRKLYNGIPIAPKSSSYANAIIDTVTNVLGNALVSYSLPAGTNKCIGYIEDRAGNRGFYFVQNSTAANNSIYRIAGTTITLVFRSAILDFASTDFIHADIIGDLLFWTNGRTEACKIDITKAIAGDYNSSPLEEITVIKRPPQLPLARTMVYDNDRITNFIGEKYYQFFYRYIYENDEYSVMSPASSNREIWGALGYASSSVSVASDTNQALTGLPTVDGVTLIASDLILLFAQTDQKENGVWAVAAGAWTRATFADTGAEIKDLAVIVQTGLEYKLKTFRNINTAAITIGVTDILFGITQGPNAISVTIEANEDIPSTVKAVEHIVRVDGSNEYTVYRIEETPLVSRTHTFYNDTFLYTLPDSETTKWNDSVPIRSESLRIQENKLFLLNNLEGYTFSTDEVIAITTSTVSAPSTADGRVPRCHPKMGGRYSAGIVYFDNYGRISSPLSTVTFEVAEHRSDGIITDFPGIAFDLTGITDIPTWATHYSIVVTEELNRSFFLQFPATDIYFYNKSPDSLYTYTKTFSASITGVCVDIRTLFNYGIGYTYNEGDRIRFITAGDSYLSADLKILEQEGSLLFCEESPGFNLNTGTGTSPMIEIYTPKANTIQPFYEYGNRYPVTNPGASATLSVTSVDFYGDIVSISRNKYSADGAYGDTTPLTNNYIYFTTRYCEAMNTFDTNFSNWIKPGGRSVIKSTIDDIESSKEGTIRWSNPYVLESRNNGLSTFDALNEYNLPSENGNGIILTERGDNLLAIFESETVSVYVGEGFVNTTNDNNFLAKTESVIGDDRRLQGNFGTQHPASVASEGGRTYYLDARRGSVIRASQDGLTVISDYGVTGEISTLCNTHIALGANSRIIGGWDPQYQCYVLSFIDISSTPTGYTYYFHEKSNAWVCLTDLRPEMWGTLNQRQLSFTAGALYMQSIETNYNLFFGMQYNRRLEFEIGQDSLVKIWDAVEIDIDSIYTTANTNEDILLLYLTNGGTLQTRINYADFQLKEGVYRSAFFRSLNDVSMANSTESKYKSPLVIRSQSAFFVITNNSTSRNPLKSITIFYTPSMASNP